MVDLHTRDPMNNRESWAPTKYVYTRGRWCSSRDTAVVSIGSRFIAEILARRYSELLAMHARGRLLDLGCGTVPLYGMYKDVVQETICVDWQHSPHGNTFVDLIADLNNPLPLDDGSFDTVLLTDVLEHVAEPLALLRQINRLLRPGGNLIAGVPFFYWVHEHPHDYFRYTEFGLTHLCAAAGLRVRSLRPYGGLPEVVLDQIAKSTLILPRVLGDWASKVHLLIASSLIKSGPVQRMSGRSAQAFPLGYSVVAEKEKSIPSEYPQRGLERDVCDPTESHARTGASTDYPVAAHEVSSARSRPT